MSAGMVLGLALPAAAVGTPQIRSPFEGSTIDVETPVEARVDESCGLTSQDTAGAVDVRLTVDGSQTFPGSQPAALQRTKACASGSEYSEWGGVAIDPSSPTAFFGADPAPMCNGRWRVQARADGGAWGTGVSFTVSRAPSAPTGLRLVVDGQDVEVSWAANPEQDLAGYRVERRATGSRSWSAVRTTTSTSTVDTGVAPGEWDYRVVALRGDGVGVAACQDTDADLTRASDTRTTTVASSSSSTDGSSTGGSSTTTDGSTDGTGGSTGTSGDGSTSSDGADGSASTDGSGTDGTTGDTDGGAESGTGGDDGSGATTGARRVAPPPAATRSGPQLDAPELPSVAGPRERYYGEGEGYSDELDFGSVDPVSGSETRSRSTTSLAERVVPQAVQDFVGRYVDPNRVLKPIAAGLVLVALALHIRRWTREQDVVRR